MVLLRFITGLVLALGVACSEQVEQVDQVQQVDQIQQGERIDQAVDHTCTYPPPNGNGNRKPVKLTKGDTYQCRGGQPQSQNQNQYQQNQWQQNQWQQRPPPPPTATSRRPPATQAPRPKPPSPPPPKQPSPPPPRSTPSARSPLPSAAPEPSRPCHEVIVIGAGLSGLSTANQLSKAGLRVALIEARDRVGGRVYNQRLKNGGVMDMGAEFIGPTQDRMYALAKELGIKLFNTYDDGDNIIHYLKQTRPLPLSVPYSEPQAVQQITDAQAKLNVLAATINVKAPWDSPRAGELDAQTFEEWIHKEASHEAARFLLTIASTTVFSAEPKELSMLYVATYVAGAGNSTHPGRIQRLVTATDGAQQTRAEMGMQHLAVELARKLQSIGVGIALNSPVRKISKPQGQRHYRVETYGPVGGEYCASRVVVAMSPPLAARIHYSPLMPASRVRLTNGMRMAAVGKAIAIYDSPWWRGNNSGQVLSDEGGARATFDNSPNPLPGSTKPAYGALMAFLEADEMRRLDTLSDAALEKEVINDYVKYFGSRAANYSQFVFKRWDHDDWARGGPVALPGMGVLSAHGRALVEPVGGIHWAGTETSDYWIGYMDGAVRSGERVAREVVASFRRNASREVGDGEDEDGVDGGDGDVSEGNDGVDGGEMVAAGGETGIEGDTDADGGEGGTFDEKMRTGPKTKTKVRAKTKRKGKHRT
ncbi:hypothetical protein BT63DRAFT_177032 [Microthyrium microscopicum]|uniref:Amine oxidase n=1 Tax=Microthyrium microscopicum TaxID=703497 RepID=A0A6A6UHB0_9PEZI|nr:hypothetical protein BT63DRAFT_177032 [Microthyrium microscopicum]